MRIHALTFASDRHPQLDYKIQSRSTILNLFLAEQLENARCQHLPAQEETNDLNSINSVPKIASKDCHYHIVLFVRNEYAYIINH